MTKANKSICAALSLFSIFGGCAKEKTQIDTQPQKAIGISYYNEAGKLAEIVAKLSEEIFPNGGVISLGKTPEGESKYVTLNVSNENGKALDISLYIGINPNIEAKLEGYLFARDYISATEILSKSRLMSLTRFHDSKINGLEVTDANDFLILRNEKGQATKLSLKEIIETYFALVETTESALKKLKKD